MPASPLFVCSAIDFSYKLGAQWAKALIDVHVRIDKGKVVCLSGPSGSGKSTLLNLLGLIEPMQQGSILFKGQELARLKEKEKNYLRRHNLGFIFQNFHLIEVLTAFENVEYFLIRQGVARAKRKELVEDALTSVGLWDHRDKRPAEMSGGQRQRVAIARALAKTPDVIIADEPTASLDRENSQAVMKILTTLATDKGVTVVVASHDPEVLRFADQIVELRDGRVLEPRREERRHAV